MINSSSDPNANRRRDSHKAVTTQNNADDPNVDSDRDDMFARQPYDNLSCDEIISDGERATRARLSRRFRRSCGLADVVGMQWKVMCIPCTQSTADTLVARKAQCRTAKLKSGKWSARCARCLSGRLACEGGHVSEGDTG